MFKRAQIALAASAAPGLLGFSGLLHESAGVFQYVTYGLFGFSLLSFLFGMFEETPVPAPITERSAQQEFAFDSAALARITPRG
ncbi:MAG TPA: hypothetical protein VLT36_13600 [Candidatus Dormibacteraeota bacterium]|nr:hypothetical protein [Candidatus Dormibacteraeota bacterium]